MLYYLIATIWLQNFQSHYGSWSKLAPTSAAMDESPNPLPPCSSIKLLHALSCNIVTLSVFIVVYSICFNNAYICTYIYIYIYMHTLDNCCIRFHFQQKDIFVLQKCIVLSKPTMKPQFSGLRLQGALWHEYACQRVQGGWITLCSQFSDGPQCLS
jgi:hypothetical protein